MEPSVSPTKFTNLQHELLKLYSINLPEHELIEIRDMIARYLLKKKLKEFDEHVKKLGITKADLEKWLNEED